MMAMVQNSASPRLPSCRNPSASTTARDDISSTNVLTDVIGMLSSSWENGPFTLWPLYTMYVEISVPKKSVSDPMKVQNPTFQVFSPVAVGGCACTTASA